MREQDDVPEWALEHIRAKLRGGEEIINAVAFKRGLFSGYVLLNTSKGAALVTKRGIGAPQSALLTYPRDLVTFTCAECGSRSLLIDADTPADVHCTHCGARNHVVPGDGEATLAGMHVPEADVWPGAHAGIDGGPYVHGDHTLYAREEATPRGRTRTSYFFSKLAPRDARETDLPPGYSVVVGRKGEPRLKRVAKKKTARRPKKVGSKGKKRPAKKSARKAPRAAKKTKTTAKKATPKKPRKKTTAQQAAPKKPRKKTTAKKATPKKTKQPRKTAKRTPAKKPRRTAKKRTSGLTEKQLAQRRYAAQMKGVRERAAKAKGGKGPVSERSAAKRLRKELGLKSSASASKRTKKPSGRSGKRR